MIRCSRPSSAPCLPPVSSAAAGIACVMAGIFFLTLSDANAKWLGASYHPLQILFLRALIALPVVTALALWLGGRRVLRTGHLRLHLARGAINVVSACCFYLGLNSLPLAEATAIAFAAPLFVTALSVFVLKERVDSRRWLAVLAGFAGVLIIVRPGTDAFQAATLLPLTTAMLYAVMMTTARGISPSEGMLTTTFYIVAGQFLCSILTPVPVWQAPAIGDPPYFAGRGAVQHAGADADHAGVPHRPGLRGGAVRLHRPIWATGRADRFKPGRPRTPARHHGHVQVQRRKPLAQHVRRAGLPLQLLPSRGACARARAAGRRARLPWSIAADCRHR